MKSFENRNQNKEKKMKKIIRLVSVIVVVASTFFVGSNVASAGMVSEPEPPSDYEITVSTDFEYHCFKNGLVFVEIENNNPTHLKMAPESIWVNVEMEIFASDAGAYSEYEPGPTIGDSDEVFAGDSANYVFLAPEGSFHGVIKVYVAESSWERPDEVLVRRIGAFCEELDIPEDDPVETTEDDPEETTEDDPKETTEDDPEETTEDDPEEVIETEIDDPIEGSPLFTG